MKRGRGDREEELALPIALRELEEEAFARGFTCVAGLDEVGRGPLAGPVMAAAVVFPRGLVNPDIKDSKILTAKQREDLVPWIKENAVCWGIGSSGPEEIDRINILQASLLAMARALDELTEWPDYLLIDGIHPIPHALLGRSSNHESPRDPSAGRPTAMRDVPHQRTVKHGDALCVSIAAASILAKVARDELMTEYDRAYPGYGFAGHKGYGSATHLSAIRQYGPSPIHRRSFRPVRESRVSDGSQGPVDDAGPLLPRR